MLSILANRTYRHLFAAQVIALIGTGLMTVPVGMSRKRGSAAIKIVANDDPCIVADTLPREPSSYPEVIDDWTATPPVTERELDIIETYLGQLIGDILKG